MSTASVANGAGLSVEPQVVTGSEDLWFLGTLARIKLDGHHTGGRFALWEGVLPRGAAPPLHSHPQDETFYVIEGEVTAWLVEPDLAGDAADPPTWVKTHRTPSASSRTPRGCCFSPPRAESRTTCGPSASRPGGRGFNRPRMARVCRPSG